MATLALRRLVSAAVGAYVRSFPRPIGAWRLIIKASGLIVVPVAPGTYVQLTRRMYAIPMKILRSGPFEPEEVAVFSGLVSPGSVVFDVGANVGVYSLLAARLGASVHAFEPGPALATALRENVTMNGLDGQVVINEAATSDAEGMARFRDDEDVLGSLDPAGGIDVRTVTLDGYCTSRGIGRVDLLKVDIEGGEARALRGATRLLSSREAPAVLIEFNREALEASGSSLGELHGLLESHGYECYCAGTHASGGYSNVLALKPPRRPPQGLRTYRPSGP